MWGNLRGWVISAVMLVTTAGIVYALSLPRRESSARNLVPLAYQAIALPVDPTTVLPAPDQDCDAADLYRQAIEQCLKHPALYEHAAADAAPRPAVEMVVNGAGCSRMHLFDVNPRQGINYDNRKPWLDALGALGQATNDVGLRSRDTQPQKARGYYEAAFRLGQNLYNERVTWGELGTGLSIMGQSAAALAKLAELGHDATRAGPLARFATSANEYRAQLQDKAASPLGNPVESYASAYAGDIFAVAKDPRAERLWRIEAILHLGRYRFNVTDGHAGDQNWAPRELRKLADDPDAVIRLAAQTAEGLTIEQQRATGAGG